MRRQLPAAVRVLFALTVLTGLAYPLLVTGVAQVGFPNQADGSLIRRDGEVVGSRLQGQVFTSPRYFHPRPSAAGDGYEGDATSGSNYGPTNPEFLGLVEERITAYRQVNGLSVDIPVPADAVTASGSGLDPHISIVNARLQAPRVARARGLPKAEVVELIVEHTDARDLGFLGEPAVNVLALNLALDDRTGR
jgi:K+-transporting ATPase ATPase C chain